MERAKDDAECRSYRNKENCRQRCWTGIYLTISSDSIQEIKPVRMMPLTICCAGLIGQMSDSMSKQVKNGNIDSPSTNTQPGSYYKAVSDEMYWVGDNEKSHDRSQMTVEWQKKKIETQRGIIEKLEQSQQLYNALVENVLSGIFIYDGIKLTFCNERFSNIFCFERDNAATIDVSKLFVNSVPWNESSAVPSKEVVVEALTCNGDKVWLKMYYNQLDSNGFNQIIGNVVDITEQIVINKQLQKTENELHALSSQLMSAQELERKRIANELHDGLGQRLSAIKFAMENLSRSMDGKLYPEQKQGLDFIIESIRNSIEEVRRVSMDLRPSILDDLGLIATIGWFCREFTLLFPAIRVDRNINICEKDIPENAKLTIFRIIQEAFHNISKHSQADAISLTLERGNKSLRLAIHDNGQGMSCIDDSKCAKGLGLKSMRERAEQTHGTFEIKTSLAEGTTVSVDWKNENS